MFSWLFYGLHKTFVSICEYTYTHTHTLISKFQCGRALTHIHKPNGPTFVLLPGYSDREKSAIGKLQA